MPPDTLTFVITENLKITVFTNQFLSPEGCAVSFVESSGYRGSLVVVRGNDYYRFRVQDNKGFSVTPDY